MTTTTATLPFLRPSSERDVLWARCRNCLGIARLLLEERRSDAFLATACHLAVENALRAALSQAGLGFDGDVEGALVRLEAPAEVRLCLRTGSGPERLPAAETIVAWLAAYLRGESPDRSWGF